MSQLSANPTEAEVLQASDCQRCRVYFHKKGPICASCRVEDIILSYSHYLEAYKEKKKMLVSLGDNSTIPSLSYAVHRDVGVTNSGSKKTKSNQDAVMNTANRIGGVQDSEFELKEMNKERVDGAFHMITKHLRGFVVRNSSLGSSNRYVLDILLEFKKYVFASNIRNFHLSS